MNKIIQGIRSAEHFGLKTHCLSFRANHDDEVRINSKVITTESFTFELWVMRSSTYIDTTHNISFLYCDRGIGFGNSSAVNFQVYIGASHVIRVTMSGVDTGSFTFNDINIWTHIAVTFDNTTSPKVLKVYKNGVEQTSHNITVTRTLSNTVASIGTSHFAWTRFHGLIDEVRAWNHVRTPEQIRRYMNIRLIGNAPILHNGILGYYPMDEGAGSTTKDFSPANNTGTLSGATWVKP